MEGEWENVEVGVQGGRREQLASWATGLFSALSISHPVVDGMFQMDQRVTSCHVTPHNRACKTHPPPRI